MPLPYEICYFCGKHFDRHECYPLFGKYYICRECQEKVKVAMKLLIESTPSTMTVNYDDLSKPDIHEVDKLWDSKRASK